MHISKLWLKIYINYLIVSLVLTESGGWRGDQSEKEQAQEPVH